MVPKVAVGAIGVPVKEGDSRGALRASAELNPVLTMDPPINRLALKDESDATRNLAFMETSPAEIIEPVKDGDASGAFKPRLLVNPVLTIDPPTNRLAFIDTSDATRKPALKDTSPVEITEPVKDGEARGALRASAELNPVLTIDPPT